MKSVSIILGLLLTLSSCSSFQYGTLFSADTTKKGKCEGQVFEQSVIDTIFETKYTKEDMLKSEAITGYSECVNTNPDIDSLMTVCQKPILFKQYMSKKRAGCDKFMLDNKLL